MKLGYVLLDGCADRPNPALGGKTPLEAARTPNLDKLATFGNLGEVITVAPGISPESDIAVFNMLGYAFEKGYCGRGLVEAIGAGLDFKNGDLALRANFASFEKDRISDRRAGRDMTEEEGRRLDEALSGIKLKDAEFEFKTTVGYRAVLVIRADEPLSGEISNTDPAYERVNGYGAAVEVGDVEKLQWSRPLEKTKAARRAAELTNEFAREAMTVLDSSKVNAERRRQGKKPANMLLFRDAGSRTPKVPSFREKHNLKGVALVEMPAEVGIAKLLGMKMIQVGHKDDLASKAKAFRKELKDGALVYAHIKGPDEFGHDGDAPGKKANIQTIDSVFFEEVAPMLGDAASFAVSCDHATPCTLKMHSSDPVPILITQGKSGARKRFTESDASKGSIGMLRGKDVLRRFTSHQSRRAR